MKISVYWSLIGYIPRPNQDLVCVRQSDAAPFCENYAKLYFDAKRFELNRVSEIFGALFSKKVQFLANIGCCPNF